ncbi:MAG: hypothetical protein Q9210_004309 [Variospora velana]
MGEKLLAHKPVSLLLPMLDQKGTETAMLGTSLDRPPGDSAWAYVRPSPDLLKHVWPKPVGDGTFEFVYLPGFPSLVTSNSNEPQGSYHSKDILSPHPTIPNAWKHVGRIDDRITLLNGEKFLPLVTEGRVQEHPLVEAAVVFGESRPVSGILVLRAHAARSMSDKEFIDAIDAAIQAANRDSEGFSKLGREMIVPLDAGTEFPVIDKRSIKQLASDPVPGSDMQRPRCLGRAGKALNENIVFETGNIINKLAPLLYRLSHNQEEEEEAEKEDEVGVMKRMIDRFSDPTTSTTSA